MKNEYLQRINKVFEYLESHLDSPVSLTILADVACYSPFHLHRIFKAITNETLNQFIIRRRVERAAQLLIHREEISISEISQQLGFRSNSVFSRTFHNAYGQSPTEFRKHNLHNFSKIGKEESKNRKGVFLTETYLRTMETLLSWVNSHGKMSIAQTAEMRVAYLTQIGELGIEKTFEKLLAWAIPKGILTQPESKVCRIFHDSFKTTDANKVRMSIGVTVSTDFQKDNVISLTHIPGGRVLVGKFEIGIDDFENAWNGLFLWMQMNGYQKSKGNPYEIYYNDYRSHPKRLCIVDFCIPIE